MSPDINWPKKLFLLERSEPVFTQLSKSSHQLSSGIELLAVLGDAGDPELLKRLFDSSQIDLIFHAAAYKHVPLVESNPLAGLVNNVLVTRTLCREALAAGVVNLY